MILSALNEFCVAGLQAVGVGVRSVEHPVRAAYLKTDSLHAGREAHADNSRWLDGWQNALQRLKCLNIRTPQHHADDLLAFSKWAAENMTWPSSCRTIFSVGFDLYWPNGWKPVRIMRPMGSDGTRDKFLFLLSKNICKEDLETRLGQYLECWKIDVFRYESENSLQFHGNLLNLRTVIHF